MGTTFKLNGGSILVSTEAPGGVYNSTQLKKMAALADTDSILIKATEDQRLALFVPNAKAGKVALELKSVGLGVRHYQDGLHQPVNCLGEFCPENAQDAMGASMELSKSLAKIAPLHAPLKIGINGCSRCCVPTHTLDISIMGEPQGYRISLGGKNSQIPEIASFMAEGVPSEKVPDLISRVVQIYQKLAQKEESFQEVMERCGTHDFVEALSPYSQDAHLSSPEADKSMPLAGPAIGDISPNDELSLAPGIDDLESSEINPDPEIEMEGLSEDLEQEEPPTLEESESPSLEGDFEQVTLDEDLGEGGVAGDSESMLTEEQALSEESQIDEPIPDDLTAEEPLAEEPLAEEALAEEALAEEALGDDSLSDDTIVEQPLAEENFAAETLENEPIDELIDEPIPETKAEKSEPVAQAAKGEDSLDDLEQADEISDGEADAFEEKIVASIAEEESLPVVQDVNQEDRHATMTMLEGGGKLPSVDAVQESLDAPTDFSNLEIADEPEEDPIQASVTPIHSSPLIQKQSSAPSSKHKPETKQFEIDSIDSIDINDQGKLALVFVSGAQFSFDPQRINLNRSHHIRIGGNKINFIRDQKGLRIEVDGMEMFLPQNAA